MSHFTKMSILMKNPDLLKRAAEKCSLALREQREAFINPWQKDVPEGKVDGPCTTVHNESAKGRYLRNIPESLHNVCCVIGSDGQVTEDDYWMAPGANELCQSYAELAIAERVALSGGSIHNRHVDEETGDVLLTIEL